MSHRWCVHHIEATTKRKNRGFCVQQIFETSNLIWIRKNRWQTLIPLIIVAQNGILKLLHCLKLLFQFNAKTKRPLCSISDFNALFSEVGKVQKTLQKLGYCLNKNEELPLLNPNIGTLAKRLSKKCFFTFGQMRNREIRDSASHRER